MWQLDSWKKYKAKHIPDYKDPEHLNRVLETLKGFPPLVFAGESVVQSGDCRKFIR